MKGVDCPNKMMVKNPLKKEKSIPGVKYLNNEK